MSNIIKKVDPIIPPNMRQQTFTQADATQDDIILVDESIGHPASQVLIESEDDALQVRFNVRHLVCPQRAGNDLMYTSHLPNLALGEVIVDETNAVIDVVSGTSYALDRDFPVRDIQLVTVSGVFGITVS